MSYDAFLMAIERVAENVHSSPTTFLSESLLPHGVEVQKGTSGGVLSASIKVMELCQAYRRPLKAIYLYFALQAVKGNQTIELKDGSVESWAIWRKETGPKGVLSGLTGALQLSELEALFLETGALPNLPRSAIALAFKDALEVEGGKDNLLLRKGGGRGLSASGFVDSLVRCSELSIAGGWEESMGATKEEATLHTFGCVVASILSSPLFGEVETLTGSKLEEMLKGEKNGRADEGEETKRTSERETTDVTETYQVLKKHYTEEFESIFESYGRDGVVPASSMQRLAWDARLECVHASSEGTQADSFDLFLRILSHWSIVCFDQPTFERLLSGSAEVAHELAGRLIRSNEIRNTIKAGGLSHSRNEAAESSNSDVAFLGQDVNSNRRGSLPVGTEELDTAEILTSLRTLFEAHARNVKGVDNTRLSNREFLRILTASGLIGFSQGTLPMAGCELVFVQGLQDKKKKNLGGSFADFIHQIDLFRERLNENCEGRGKDLYISPFALISDRIIPRGGPRASPDKASVENLFTLHKELFELVFSAFTMEAKEAGKQWGDGFHCSEGLIDVDGFLRFGESFGLLGGDVITTNLLQLLHTAHAKSRTSFENDSHSTGLSSFFSFSGFGKAWNPVPLSGTGEQSKPPAMDYEAFLKALTDLSVVLAPTVEAKWPEKLGKLLDVMCHSGGAKSKEKEPKITPAGKASRLREEAIPGKLDFSLSRSRDETAHVGRLQVARSAKKAKDAAEGTRYKEMLHKDEEEEDDGYVGVGAFAYATSPIEKIARKTPPPQGKRVVSSVKQDSLAFERELDRRQTAYTEHLRQSPGNSYSSLHAKRKASTSEAGERNERMKHIENFNQEGGDEFLDGDHAQPIQQKSLKPKAQGYGNPLSRYAAARR